MQTNKKNINKKIIIILGETKGEHQQQIKTKVKNRLDQPERTRKKRESFFSGK